MITPEFVGHMLNTVAEGLVVSACVWLAMRWFKPLNSGTRFAVWFSTLLAIVALPFLAQSNSVPAAAAYPHTQLALPSSWAFYLLIACEFCASRRAVHGVRSPAKGLLLFAARLGSLIPITPETGHLFPLIKGMASLLAGDERTGDFGILRMHWISHK